MATLSQFLISEIKQNGINEVYGIAGDFVLDLFSRLEESEAFNIIRLSHEPGIGFAAQAASRATNNLGICCVTYGVGALNTINPVACAYAERVPLVLISGGPGKKEAESGLLLHHQVKNLKSQLQIFQELTDAAFILDDPNSAAKKIREAFLIAKTNLRPVYLELPRDMVDAEISIPSDLENFKISKDILGTKEAAKEILAKIDNSTKATLMVGVEVERYGLTSKVVQLAEKFNLPVVTSFLGRSAFPLEHPNFLGSFCGFVSPAEVKSVVEGSDCLIMLGVLLTDTNMGKDLLKIPNESRIHAINKSVLIEGNSFNNVLLSDLIDELITPDQIESLKGGKDSRIQKRNSNSQENLIRIKKPKRREFKIPSSQKPIKVSQVVDGLNWFLNNVDQMPLVVDTGDVLFASYELHAAKVYSTSFYATMGFAVPSALGIAISTKNRPLVMVGDGAFQMTGSEISWAPFYELNPIIVVFNNSAWEMLKGFKPDSHYNDIISWPFETLANAWGGKGYKVTTANHFMESLLDAYKQKYFTIIDVEIGKGDITNTLKCFTEQIIKGRK